MKHSQLWGPWLGSRGGLGAPHGRLSGVRSAGDAGADSGRGDPQSEAVRAAPFPPLCCGCGRHGWRHGGHAGPPVGVQRGWQRASRRLRRPVGTLSPRPPWAGIGSPPVHGPQLRWGAACGPEA